MSVTAAARKLCPRRASSRFWGPTVARSMLLKTSSIISRTVKISSSYLASTTVSMNSSARKLSTDTCIMSNSELADVLDPFMLSARVHMTGIHEKYLSFVIQVRLNAARRTSCSMGRKSWRSIHEASMSHRGCATVDRKLRPLISQLAPPCSCRLVDCAKNQRRNGRVGKRLQE